MGKKTNETKRKRVVAVSGGFDPVHIGHVRMFNEAKLLGDHLIVIVNNDHWLKNKKGYAFMEENDRTEIVKSFKVVDDVLLTAHKPNGSDMSVCQELAEINPDVFANGGDRSEGNVPEYDLCNRLGITMVFNVGAGGKVRSSSELVAQGRNKAEQTTSHNSVEQEEQPAKENM